MKRRNTYRMTVRLDVEHDADLIAWLSSVTLGSRSALLRDTLRAGLRQPARWEPVDIDEMRRMVAEELARALAGRPVVSETTAPEEDVDMEKKYGAKLNRMMGGLARDSPAEDDG
jgi:predicted exporter